MAEPIKDPYSGNVIAPTVSIPKIDTSSVYSPQNVSQAMSTPTTKPNLADPYGLYDYYMSSGDILSAQNALKSTTEQYNKALATSRTQQTAIENLPQALNVIRGEQAQAGRLASDTLASLSEAKLAQQSYLDSMRTEATNKYNIALNERTQLQELIRSTKGKAGISYADSYEKALQKAAKWEEDEKEKAEKHAYKEELKKQLTALGKSTKGLSRNELEKKLAKYNKSALEEAKRSAELDYKIKLKSLNKGSGSEDKDYEKKEKQLYSDIDNLRDKMSNDKMSWNTAWNTINTRYPGFEDYEIDQLLGLDYRIKLEGR